MTGSAFSRAGQAHLVQRGANPLCGFPARETGDRQRQHDVLERIAIEEQLLVLKHHADAPPQIGQGRSGESADILAADQDRATGGLFNSGNELQQGGFPAPECPLTSTISRSATSKLRSDSASTPGG
jgi:hypothetical protein